MKLDWNKVWEEYEDWYGVKGIDREWDEQQSMIQKIIDKHLREKK